MLATLDLPLILLAAFIAGASPGPATLAIAGTSMANGRAAGLALASGITAGSFTWSISAALGLSALMLTNVWMLESVRYVGALYLMYLAYKSARSAFSNKELKTKALSGSIKALFSKGYALHVTNPKAILFFGSLFAIGVPPESSPIVLLIVILAVGVQSALLFHAYALLFSTNSMTRIYVKLRRWFEGAFAIGFGGAGVKILTARLQ